MLTKSLGPTLHGGAVKRFYPSVALLNQPLRYSSAEGETGPTGLPAPTIPTPA